MSPIRLQALIDLNNPVIQFIRQATLTSNLRPTAILTALRESGLTIRTQTFYQLSSMLRRQLSTSINYVQRLGLNELPNPSNLEKTLTDRDTNYTYLVEGYGIDEDTGDTIPQYVTVISNRLLTKVQVTDTATMMLLGNEKYGLASLTSLNVIDIRQNRAGLR